MSARQRTLGIDLAKQPRKTATCVIEWAGEKGRVLQPNIGQVDEALLAEMESADWTGIDAPFGWPIDFVEAMGAYGHNETWPAGLADEKLRSRETDRNVRKLIKGQTDVKVSPMSVSLDKLGACAIRCASLLVAHAKQTEWVFDRTGASPSSGKGSGGTIEAYPAASLAIWKLPHKGYKDSPNKPKHEIRATRKEILSGLSNLRWDLTFEGGAEEACIENDDAIDALITALVTREAAAGRTVLPATGQMDAAQREGWIHLPDVPK